MSKAEELGALMGQLALDMEDVRAALVEQGQDGVGAPTSAMGDLIRGINPSPPVLITGAVLSGVAEAGLVLTTTLGEWIGAAPLNYAVQRYRNGAAISGATSISYADQ